MLNTATTNKNRTRVRELNDRREGERNPQVYGRAISLILSQYEARSKNTFETYKRSYMEFIDMVVGKEKPFVSWKDIVEIDYLDVLEYRENLQKKGNSNRTINLKMAAISSIFEELAKVNRYVRPEIARPTKLNEREEEINNSYGSLTEEEMEELFLFCRKLPANRQPYARYMFFKVAYQTAIRQGALLRMTWGDIKRQMEDGEIIRYIQIEDKGKIDKTPISKQLYEEMEQMKGFDTKDTDRVFPTTRKTLSGILAEFCKFNGIPEERNIVLHSIKKASVDKVYRETNDITATARHAHHISIETTFNNYEGKNKTLKDRPSLFAFTDNKAKDLEEQLKDKTREEIMEAIRQLDNTSKKKLSDILKD